MPVKIRLTRMGKKRQPSYRVVVMDSRSARDGRYIDQIGRYDPRQEPSLIEIDNDKALDWLEKGAQPTDTAKKLLEVSGAWTRFRIARGDIHIIDAPPAKAAPSAAEIEAEIAGEPEIHVVETFEDETVTPDPGAAPVEVADAVEAVVESAPEPVADAAEADAVLEPAAETAADAVEPAAATDEDEVTHEG